VRTSHQSSKQNTNLSSSATTSGTNTGASESTTSSTSKYFRNIITKMHGGGSSNSTAATSAAAVAATSTTVTSPKTSSSFQSFSLIAPQPTSSTGHSQQKQQTASNDFAIFGRPDSAISSGSLWNQLKSTSHANNPTSAAASLSSYNSLIPFGSAAATTVSRRKLHTFIFLNHKNNLIKFILF
jgi:hypothetical protein